MTTSEERLSRLEGAYEHLATKADLQALEARVVKQVGDSETRMVKWMVGLMIGSVAAATAIASTVALLVG